MFGINLVLSLGDISFFKDNGDIEPMTFKDVGNNPEKAQSVDNNDFLRIFRLGVLDPVFFTIFPG